MKKKEKEESSGAVAATTSSPAGSKRPKGKTDSSSPNGSISIPVPGTSTNSGKRITTNSPVSNTSRQDFSIVDIVTDRVIDKLCRLDLTGETKQRSSSRADETQIQLVDYSFNAVVMITLIARRPTPGRKYQFFKGTVYLSTNDIRLAEDVDKLLDSLKKRGTGRGKKTLVNQSEGESTGASQESPEKEEQRAKRTSPANNNEIRGASGQETSELESDSSHNSQEGKPDSCLNGIESPEDQVSESRGPVDDENESSGDVNEEHQVLRTRKSGSQRDPRGRKVGSMISCKTLESLESRMMDRVSKLRPVIESHGYDYELARVIDQTEMARITYGVHEIAFQRLVVHSRAKTSRDLQQSLEKGTIQKMQPSH